MSRMSKSKRSDGASASDDREAARQKCLRLLSVRMRSEGELRQRLRKADFAAEAIEDVLSDLARVGLVDDAEFARSWVASRKAAGGSGPRKLWSELRAKGVADDVLRGVLSEEMDEETERSQAMEFARRRLRGRPADDAALGRLRRLLVGRGFGFGTVDSVLASIAAERDE